MNSSEEQPRKVGGGGGAGRGIISALKMGGGSITKSYTTVPTLIMMFFVIYFVGDTTMHLFGATRTHLRDDAEFESDASVVSAVAWVGHEPGCTTVEDFLDDQEYDPSTYEKAWRQMKWVLPPAKCRVKGLLIDRLDPLYNYRRGVALHFSNDGDDKMHLEHWFLGARVDLNKRKRRVFIDLGANSFFRSVTWFSTRYPVDFTEVHAFEVQDSFKLPVGFDEETNWLDPGGRVGTEAWRKIKARGDGGLPKWMVERVHPYRKFAGVEDEDQANSINITRFIKNELNLTKDDTVVVKMDIEGAEWAILQEWMNDPEMPLIVDELWVEVHYYHPPDNDWKFVSNYTRDMCNRMLAEMRFKGWYVHYWD